ncbi:MAG TPA: SRPBCC domain-containing protein [Polyangiaceae bacterium]|nr:SRPBCC domain-containing protein [Polyangiaceae bacterium]
MTSGEDLRITLPSDHEIVHERFFRAPRRLVFAAISRADLLARWYGPPGWTLVACESDFRIGGAWRFVTRKPNGREIVQSGVYTEIIPPERFVKTEHWIDWDVGEVLVTTELAEHDGRTKMTVTSRFPSKQVRDQLVASGANRGVREHYEKLQAFLEVLGGEPNL